MTSDNQTDGFLVNPFLLLGVPLNASREDIAFAFDDVLAEGTVSAEQLRDARQKLLSPNSRLVAELSYLPDAPKDQAEEVVKLLKGGAPLSDLLSVTGELPPLSRSNVLAHIASWRPSSGVVRSFSSSQSEVDPEKVFEAITSIHRDAGMPNPTIDAVREALSNVQARASERLFVAYDEPPAAARDIVQCLENELEDSDPDLIRAYTNVVQGYQKFASGLMHARQREVEDALEKVRSDTVDESAVEHLGNALREWDELAQPQQLLALHKGRDDPQSRQLFESLRALVIDLANDFGATQTALKVSNLAKETFAELPRASKQLKDDIYSLEDLQALEGARELVEFVQQNREDLHPLADSIRSQGFRASSSGIAGQLYKLFDDSIRATEGSTAAETPWRWVRVLALDINNEFGEPRTSRALVQGLVAHAGFKTAPDEIRAQIRADLNTLEENILQDELNKALQAKDRTKTRKVLQQLIQTADTQSDRQSYEQMVQALDRVQRRQYIKFGFWAAVIVGIIIFVSNENYNDRSSNVRVGSGSNSNSTVQSTPSTEPGHQEMVKPPVGTNQVLSRANIRFCLYTKERLDTLHSTLPAQIENPNVLREFNALVDDYNSRCSSYRYYENDMTAVEREVENRQSELRSEAFGMLEDWRAQN